MKKFLNSALLCSIMILSCNFCIAAEVSSDTPKPIMPRIGKDNQVEERIEIIQQTSVKNTEKSNKSVTYSDKDLKKIADEITADLNDEYDNVLSDLRVLWQASVERSETIKFAIYKLSNPEGEKVDPSTVKKLLAPIASVAPMMGMSSGNPIAGTGSIFGGGMLNSLLSDNSEINHKLSRVTDADLVILAKEIDSLQEKLVSLYYNYITTMKLLQLSDKNVENRYKYYMSAQNSSPDALSVADAFYREALDRQYNARQNLLRARAELEQFVGNDALSQVENDIKKRESKS